MEQQPTGFAAQRESLDDQVGGQRVLAQMLVRAVHSGGTAQDVDKMIAGLEGWSFDGVKGTVTIRAADHALLQPMYQVKLAVNGSTFTPQVVKTLSADAVAPPVAAMKG
ncbi:ABC transporter substrate-binding protein [Catenulispora subtropica]|uniref:Lipoprotein n=1 Tax=Catenulispora subtropica TaxID=450798 RepID=A0ABP5EIQ0_9ACTN